ncbi:MAG: hypothetical protein AAF703_17295 [Cyanobacteria bacterium P01_D01_bin.105]
MKNTFWSLFLWMLLGCTAQSGNIQQTHSQPAAEESVTLESAEMNEAQITDVAISGKAGNYTFAVTVASPDSGCEAYANWWEVVSPEGALLYRRILAHSHVEEQPFTRSGGPIAIAADQPTIVRVHMHPVGYSSLAMKGTPLDGFAFHTLPEAFGDVLSEAAPQPNGCAF